RAHERQEARSTGLAHARGREGLLRREDQGAERESRRDLRARTGSARGRGADGLRRAPVPPGNRDDRARPRQSVQERQDVIGEGAISRNRHARTCSGHPRLKSKSWMAGTSLAMALGLAVALMVPVAAHANTIAV